MSKKLFLAVLPLLALAMASCSRGNGGASSQGGGSGSGGSSGGASGDESSEVESSGEESTEESSEEESISAPEAEITLTIGSEEIKLYVDEDYTPGDTSDMAAKAKYFTAKINVTAGDSIELGNLGDLGYGANPDGEGTNKNNKNGKSAGEFTVHNDAEGARLYVYEYDGVTYGSMPGYSFWLTGYSNETPEGYVDVSFKINYGTDWGDGVFLLPDGESSADLNYRLEWTTGNDWVGTFSLPAGEFNFKFATASYDNGGTPSRVESSGHTITVVDGIEEQVVSWNA